MTRNIVFKWVSVFLVVTFASDPLLRAALAQTLSTTGISRQLSVDAPMGLSVNTFNGNLYHARTLLALPQRAAPLTLTLSYNSLQSGTDNGFGFGWQLDYNVSYLFSGDHLAIYWGDGRIDRYTWDGATFSSPPGVLDTLEEYELNRYRLMRPDGSAVYFASPGHRLVTSIIDPNGNALNFAYSGRNLASITDSVGRRVTFTYDDSGRLAEVSDANVSPARTARLEYDDSGNLTRLTDATGVSTSYNYDGRLLASVTDALDHNAQISYSAGMVAAITTAEGEQSFAYDFDPVIETTVTYTGDGTERARVYSYDYLERISSVQDALNNYQVFTYDETSGQLAGVMDANVNTTQFTYDERGNILTATDATGATTTYTYDERDHVTSAQDADDNLTTLEYDERGNLTRIMDAMGGETILQVGERGEVTSMTDTLGNTTTYTYDDFGNLSAITDPLGRTREFEYDAAVRLRRVTDPDGTSVSAEYDASGKPGRIIDAGGRATTIAYDAAGNPSEISNGDGSAYRYTYNARGQMTSVTDPMGGETVYEYDAAGNLIAMTDALGNTTTYTFDAENRILSETDVLGNTTTYEHDGVGNLTAYIAPDGKRTTYEYDAVNRLTRVTYPDSKVIEYIYDALGRRSAIRVNFGDETTYAYDALGRTTSVTDANGDTVGYAYDAAGSLLELAYADGSTVRYTYDAAGQLIEVTDSAGTTTYTYDAVGRMSTRALPNDVTTTYAYTPGSMLESVTHANANGEPLLNFAYTFDSAGRRASMMRGAGGETTSTEYTYDALGRLTRADYGDTFEAFTYDAVGNRLTRATPDSETAYSYNAINQLIALSGGETSTFEYDARGNLVRRDNVAYEYDYANRLLAVTGGNAEVEYAYDGDGRRVEKIVDGDSTRYTYDVTGLLPQVIAQSDAGGNRRYTLGDMRFAAIADGGTVYYLEDGLGSVAAVTDVNGDIVQAIDYTSFGVPDDAAAFAFTGEQYDAESGLLYLRARYYQPDTGRFLTPDPAPNLLAEPQLLHDYAYAVNNPINMIDPTGLVPWDQIRTDVIVMEGVKIVLSLAAVVGAVAFLAGVTASTPAIVIGLGVLALMGAITAATLTTTVGFNNIARALNGEIPIDAPSDMITLLMGNTPESQLISNIAALAFGKFTALTQGPETLQKIINGMDFRYNMGSALIKGWEIPTGKPARGDQGKAPAADSGNTVTERLESLSAPGESRGSPPAIGAITTYQTGTGRTTTYVSISDADGDAISLRWRFIESNGTHYGASEGVVDAQGSSFATTGSYCWCVTDDASTCPATIDSTFTYEAIDLAGNTSAAVSQTESCVPEIIGG